MTINAITSKFTDIKTNLYKDEQLLNKLSLFPGTQQVAGIGTIGYHSYKAAQAIKTIATLACLFFKDFKFSNLFIKNENREINPKSLKGRIHFFKAASNHSAGLLAAEMKQIGVGILRTIPVVGTVYSIHVLFGKNIQQKFNGAILSVFFH